MDFFLEIDGSENLLSILVFSPLCVPLSIHLYVIQSRIDWRGKYALMGGKGGRRQHALDSKIFSPLPNPPKKINLPFHEKKSCTRLCERPVNNVLDLLSAEYVSMHFSLLYFSNKIFVICKNYILDWALALYYIHYLQ